MIKVQGLEQYINKAAHIRDTILPEYKEYNPEVIVNISNYTAGCTVYITFKEVTHSHNFLLIRSDDSIRDFLDSFIRRYVNDKEGYEREVQRLKHMRGDNE